MTGRESPAFSRPHLEGAVRSPLVAGSVRRPRAVSGVVRVTAVVVAVLLTGLLFDYGWHHDRLNLTREITRLGDGK